MPDKKPTLILVHGAWHGIETWDKVSLFLEGKQFKCIAVALPSTAGDASATFGEDVNAVREAILAETTQGNEVVLVLHSYGGVVGQSAIKGLDGVLGILLMTSFFAITGVSIIDAMGGKPPPLWRPDDSGFAIVAVPVREALYHDLPQAEGELWASKLKKQSQRPLFEGGEHAYAGWMDVPVWYLVSTDDKACPVEVQMMFIKGAQDAGADVTVREIHASHSPMLSKPQETVEFILEAVTVLTKRATLAGKVAEKLDVLAGKAS